MGGGASQFEGYENRLLNDSSEIVSFAVPGSAEEGASPIYRHPDAKDGLVGYLADENKEELDTGLKFLQASVQKFGARNAYGFRPFTNPDDITQRGEFRFMTYNETNELFMEIGMGLKTLELGEKVNVGLYSVNRVEWMMGHYANWTNCYRTVALYDTLGAEAVSYIIGHAELQAIISEKSKLDNLFTAIESDRESVTLKYIIQMDFDERFGNTHEAVDDAARAKAEELGIQLIGLSELRERGRACEDKSIIAPNRDDLAFIMYTSGTTGNPKGVMLTHSNFAAVVASSFRGMDINGSPINETDSHLSFLPLAHIFEAVIQTVAAAAGASIAFYQGDIRKLSDDWKEIKPTLLFGVPRIFTKTYDRVQLTVDNASSMKKFLFQRAQSSSTVAVRSGRRSGMWDKVIWKKVAGQMGFENVRFLLSGAAPLAPHVGEFLKVVITDGVVCQGYGMTETCAAACVSLPNDLNLGHVGIPIDNCEIRLVDAPECEYSVLDEPCPRGEIQLRGLGITVGYYKNEEATQKTLSEDGWLSTGDIGRINPNGTLSIIDRRKNMFKTSIGEYVAAEKIETVLSRADGVGQMWVYGNSFKSFIVAVVVPDAMVLVGKFKEEGVWTDAAEACKPGTIEFANAWSEIAAQNQELVKGYTMQTINELDTDLKKFEKVKDILIEYRVDELLQGFNVATNTMTPSFKLRRPQLLQRYKEQLKELYGQNGEAPIDGENW